MEEIQGYYGSGNTPCTIYQYNGWYCVEGGSIVNYCGYELELGTDVEEVEDSDTFSWPSEINSIDELIEAVES